MLALVNGIVETIRRIPKGGAILIVDQHAGKSGKSDGRLFRCTVHRDAGGADDGHFREGGLAWHATDGGCNVAADALALPEDVRKASSRARRSPEEQRAAMVERARRKALGN
jgi:hypothetical protein